MLNGFELIMYLLGIIALLAGWIRICMAESREHGIATGIICVIPLAAIVLGFMNWKQHKLSLILGFIGIVMTGAVQPKVTASFNEFKKQKQQELEGKTLQSGQEFGPADVFRSV